MISICLCGFQHLLSSALSEVAARASANPGPAFQMSFPCKAKESEQRATTAGTSGKASSGKRKEIRGKKSLKMLVTRPLFVSLKSMQNVVFHVTSAFE